MTREQAKVLIDFHIAISTALDNLEAALHRDDDTPASFGATRVDSEADVHAYFATPTCCDPDHKNHAQRCSNCPDALVCDTRPLGEGSLDWLLKISKLGYEA